MTNQAYLKALKKALAGMDSASRDDIIREIESYVDESGADGQSLTERFGTPETLAQQYLDGETLRAPLPRKAGGMFKRVLMWVGGSVLVLALLIAVLVYWFTQDAFDYGDENAAELTAETRSWAEVPLDTAPVFEVDQSKIVFYWHDQAQVRWSCKGEDTPVQNEQGGFDLRHKDCLVYLPQQALTLKGNQADIILVRPQADVSVTLQQSRLRIAENNTTYRYVIDARRSNSEGLQSDGEAALQISVKANESNLGLYRH